MSPKIGIIVMFVCFFICIYCCCVNLEDNYFPSLPNGHTTNQKQQPMHVCYHPCWNRWIENEKQNGCGSAFCIMYCGEEENRTRCKHQRCKWPASSLTSSSSPSTSSSANTTFCDEEENRTRCKDHRKSPTPSLISSSPSSLTSFSANTTTTTLTSVYLRNQHGNLC